MPGTLQPPTSLDQARRYLVCGQLAGAYWGESGIPAEWREGLARPEMIEKALLG
jgi:hypothetical protein